MKYICNMIFKMLLFCYNNFHMSWNVKQMSLLHTKNKTIGYALPMILEGRFFSNIFLSMLSTYFYQVIFFNRFILDCQSDGCICKPNYQWDTNVCKEQPACCQNNKPCITPSMCIFKDRGK